jgi:hypothetical protein
MYESREETHQKSVTADLDVITNTHPADENPLLLEPLTFIHDDTI